MPGCDPSSRAGLLGWAATAASLLGLLTAAVLLSWTGSIDHTGRLASSSALGRGLGPSLRFVEVAFDQPAMTLYTVVLVVALVVGRLLAEAAVMAVVVAGTALATVGVKVAVGRDRPPWQWPQHELAGYAFPSGHTSSVTALCGALVLVTIGLARRRRIGKTTARAAVACCVVLVAIVAADRVLLGRHYPTDVLGGLLLGVMVVCLAAALVGGLGDRVRRGARDEQERTQGRRDRRDLPGADPGSAPAGRTVASAPVQRRRPH